MFRTDVPRSSSLRRACHHFLDTLQAWVEACIARHDDQPPLGPDHHDQLTYTTPWATLIEHREHDAALGFMKRRRDQVVAHYEQCGAWYHGYWKRQEAHHGTEHFELFLGTLQRLDPEDRETRRQLEDAAEHFGNWSDAAPAFFDWDTGLFRSVYLGTEHVGDDPAAAINMPDHVRFINIALPLFSVTANSRYLSLAKSHMSKWAEAINGAAQVPLALLPSGPLETLDDQQAATYAGFAGAAGITQASAIAPIDRAENFLASSAVQTLLAMWRHTGVDAYRRAAERLIDELATQLGDPDAGAAAAIIRDYRDATSDRRYDERVVSAVAPVIDALPHALTLLPQQTLGRGGGGVGKRSDMPAWQVDQHKPRPVHPITLLLAGQIEGAEAWVIQAVDLAHAHFRLASQAFRSGRHHGCCAQSVSAVARGHGRDNDAGMVTAVLAPALRML